MLLRPIPVRLLLKNARPSFRQLTRHPPIKLRHGTPLAPLTTEASSRKPAVSRPMLAFGLKVSGTVVIALTSRLG